MISTREYTSTPVPQYGEIYPMYPLFARIPQAGKYSIKIGSIVSWEVNSKRKDSHKPFTATGKVTKIYQTTFGSTMRKEAAQVETYDKYLEIFPGRKHTTVSMDKLKLIH